MQLLLFNRHRMVAHIPLSTPSLPPSLPPSTPVYLLLLYSIIFPYFQLQYGRAEPCGPVPTNPASQAWTSVLAWYTCRSPGLWSVALTGALHCQGLGNVTQACGILRRTALAPPPSCCQISQPVYTVLSIAFRMHAAWRIIGLVIKCHFLPWVEIGSSPARWWYPWDESVSRQ